MPTSAKNVLSAKTSGNQRRSAHGSRIFAGQTEENNIEKSDLYLLTLSMLDGKITFEEWLQKTVLWAREVMQLKTEGGEKWGKEAY